MRYLLVLAMIISPWGFLHAQELENVSYKFQNDTVYVHYDFLKGIPDTDYEFYLYSSLDNFKSPLKYTTGDIGKHVRTGANRLVKWAAVKELGNFKGDIRLKVKGEKYVPFVRFDNMPKNQHLTRGKDFEMKWTTASDVDKVNIQVCRFNVPVTEALTTQNDGAYILTVPDSLRAGKGYRLKITDPDNPIKAESSNEFAIKRRWPIAWKIIPVAVVATAGIFILNHKEPGAAIEDPPGPPTIR